MTHPADASFTDADGFAAFEYAFPLYEMAKLRRRAVHDRADPGWTGQCVYWHQERLATADDRWVTTPNNDTLYSVAWVDLAQSPVRIRIPPTDGRYLNLAILDAFSNNFACLSQRDVGSEGATFILVGPDWREPLPRDEVIIAAPGRDAMLFARTLVNDDADLLAARRIQHGFTVVPLVASDPAPMPARTDDPAEDFLRVVRDALVRNPPRPWESDIQALLTRTGLLGMGADSAALDVRWASLLPGFLATLAQTTRRTAQAIDQWVYSQRETGDFGTAYRLRAMVALGGLLALPGSEAFYISTDTDAQGQALDGKAVSSVELPADGLPADAFWSLTLYEKMPNGARFLAHNVLNRYAFTDRSAGLQARDGRITVWVSAARPPAALESNWLPAPEGPYRLAVRLYHPRPEVLGGRFRIRPVQRFENYEQALAR